MLDEVYLYRAIRYVERNPVRAGIVKEAWKYPWSSAKEHTDSKTKSIIPLSKSFTMSKEEWKEYLREDDEEMTREMRLKTSRGLVVGTEKFIKKIEKKLDRSLECLNPGRPWKRVSET